MSDRNIDYDSALNDGDSAGSNAESRRLIIIQ